MKRILTVFIILFFLVSCESSIIYPINEKAVRRPYIDVSTYNEEAYLRPIWNTREIYDETILFIGPTSYCTLIYAPTKIFNVRSSTLQIEYEEGVDYRIEGNKIYRLEGSRIPYLDIEKVFTETEGKMYWTIKYPGRFADFGITAGTKCLVSDNGTNVQSEYVKNMICISYAHSSKNIFSIPEDQSKKASAVFKRLKNNEAVRILFYGDSITVGCSSSARYNLSPYVPMWPKIVFKYLTEYFGNTNAVYLNTAVGGWSTINGVDNFQAYVADQNADVLFLAFGMNDNGRSSSDYQTRIQSICNKYLMQNPNGFIILIPPMVPSTLYYDSNQTLYDFEGILKNIADNSSNIIYAPVTTLFRELLGCGVDTIDYLANNVNHPNDFATRLYAQVILKSLMGDRFFKESWLY